MSEPRKRGRPPNKPPDPAGLALAALLPEPIGSEIRAARKRAGQSQHVAAAIIGCNRYATWSDYERGVVPMPALAWTMYMLAVGQHPRARLCQAGPPIVSAGPYDASDSRSDPCAAALPAL